MLKKMFAGVFVFCALLPVGVLGQSPEVFQDSTVLEVVSEEKTPEVTTFQKYKYLIILALAVLWPVFKWMARTKDWTTGAVLGACVGVVILGDTRFMLLGFPAGLLLGGAMDYVASTYFFEKWGKKE